MIRTLISFVLVFNIIVFVHELGHYVMARRAGIRIHEFALGMGPTIWKKEKNNTIYALRALPIGGFVKMEGEDTDSDAEDSFNSKSPAQRFGVIVAGAMMNLFLAFFIILVINLSLGQPTLTLSEITPNSPAQEAGMLAGDTITGINGKSVSTWEEALMIIGEAEGELVLDVKRDGETLTFRVMPEESDGRMVIGIVRGTSRNPLTALSYTFKQVGFLLTMMLGFFRDLFTGKANLEGVVGPIGLATFVGESARGGIISLALLTAYISLNLAVVNLLPIPALDGGRLLFILIEMLRGKPIPPEKEGMVHTAGLILLLLLIVFITYQDIVRLFQ